MLKNSLSKLLEAGVDEAGRGALAGSVFAAAVILPPRFYHGRLDDSKRLTERRRNQMRKIIIENAIAYSVAEVPAERIDETNILQATFEAMNKAVAGLGVRPKILAIDGPYFKTESDIAYNCIIRGDAKYANIAAASILAKTARDDQMKLLGIKYPEYNWKQNKGYATFEHRQAIIKHGVTPYHRRSFTGVKEYIYIANNFPELFAEDDLTDQ